MSRAALPSLRSVHVLALLALWLGVPLLAGAFPDDSQLTIYRCTNARGQLSLRDTPCLPGEHQQTMEMQRLQDPPSRPPDMSPPKKTAAMATIAAPPASPTEPLRAPSPPVYQCTTPDGEQYTSDSADGNPRWVPLWTLGYYPVIAGAGHGHRPGRYPPPVRPASAAPYAGSRNQSTSYSRPGFVFDSVGRPSPKPPENRPGTPDLPPTGRLKQGPGTWIRDACTLIPQAEVCNGLRERHSTLSRRYNSALQSERREIDSEKHRINERLTSECTP